MGDEPRERHNNLPWDPIANVYFLDDGSVALRFVGTNRQKIPNPQYHAQMMKAPDGEFTQQTPSGPQYIEADVFRMQTKICKNPEEIAACIADAILVVQRGIDTGVGVVAVDKYHFPDGSEEPAADIPESM